jgi:hypothetical protein
MVLGGLRTLRQASQAAFAASFVGCADARGRAIALVATADQRHGSLHPD